MDGAALVGGHGEAGLVDHGLQGTLSDVHGELVIHLRQLRIVVGGQAQNLKAGVAAGQMDGQIFIRRKHDHIVRHFPDHLAEQPGAEDDAAWGLDLGVHDGADAGLHVVAGQGQGIAPLQQDPLQGRNGAFGGYRPGGGVDGALQQRLFTGKSKHKDAFLSFRMKRDSVLQKRTKRYLYFSNSRRRENSCGKVPEGLKSEDSFSTPGWGEREGVFHRKIRGPVLHRFSPWNPQRMWKEGYFLLLMLVVISLTFSA